MIRITAATTRMWSMLGSAGTFGQAALEFPELDDESLIMTADLRNFSGLDRFAQRYPERLINVGIAEQNMVGVAAGLASEGYNVFATTYATFASARSADAVRVNMGYMGLGVKLVGMASGFSVGVLGPTHMGLEDIAIMRSIPNITVISPADCSETVKAAIALVGHQGPAYLRLGGGVPHPVVNASDYDFKIGKAIFLREGHDVALVATGSVVSEALVAADLLSARGVSASVVNMHTLVPLDEVAIQAVARSSDLVVTLEEHSICGGLGSAVAESLAESGTHVRLSRLGVRGSYPHAGDYRHLLDQCGLTGERIADHVSQSLGIFPKQNSQALSVTR